MSVSFLYTNYCTILLFVLITNETKKEEMYNNAPFSYGFHMKHTMFTNRLCYLSHSGVNTPPGEKISTHGKVISHNAASLTH